MRTGARVVLVSYRVNKPALVYAQVFDRSQRSLLGAAAGKRVERGRRAALIRLHRATGTGLRVVLAAVPVRGGGAPTVISIATQPRRPSFTILSPTPGSTITGRNVVVRLQSQGLRITDQGTRPKSREGHFHIILDERTYIVVYRTTFVLRGVAPGPHRLVVVAAQNDHAPSTTQRPAVVSFRVR